MARSAAQRRKAQAPAPPVLAYLARVQARLRLNPPHRSPHWHNRFVVESSLGPLLPLFDRERAAGNALAAGVLVHTAGSTYRKAGALMLIAANGEYSGLLSGGCLEGDLREHARSVIETGQPQIVTYDMRGPEDLLWGLGLGCEGAMRILLLRIGPDRDWQPLTHLARALAAHSPTAVGIVTDSATADVPAGTLVLPESVPGNIGRMPMPGTASAGEPAAAQSPPVSPAAIAQPIERATLLPGDLSERGRAMLADERVVSALAEAARDGSVSWVEHESPAWKLFVLPLALPPRLLVLGAGPDAAPVVRFATELNWKVTVADHRAAYADPTHFPGAERVVQARPEELPNAVDLARFSAAVVMSHHLPSDLAYLRLLAESTVPYVGLLGPAVRREKLLADLGPQAQQLRPRLRAPVGLPLGGRTPESIALSIVAEVHAFVHGAEGLHPDSRPL